MANELIQSRKLAASIPVEEAKSTLLRSASRFGKSYADKKGNVVLRPRTAMNRIKIATEVEENRSGSSVVTYVGKIRPTLISVLLFIVIFGVLLALAWWASFIAAVIFIVILKNWQKGLTATFKDATANAMEAMS